MKTVKPDYEQSYADGMAEIIKEKQNLTPKSIEKLSIPKVSPKSIRADMKISQQDFSDKFGIPLATLRNWEQGRTDPDAPTSVLLYLISKFPDFVESEMGKLRKK